MNIVLKDGTVLPDVPSDVKEQYPFVTIVYMHSNIGTENEAQEYHLIGSKAEWIHYPNSISGIGYDCAITTTTPILGYYCLANDSSSWLGGSEVDEGFFQLGASGIHDNAIVWSNYDVMSIAALDANTGSYTLDDKTYFKNCIFRLPDGTELPALPEGCFEKYPYGVIAVQTFQGETTYGLCAFPSAVAYIPTSLTGDGFNYVGLAEPKWTSWSCIDGSWVNDGEADSYPNLPLDFVLEAAGASVTVLWFNHDVYTATACETDERGVFYPTEVGPDLYRKSDVNYRIYGGWLNSMGNQARRLGNVSGALKPGEMESTFKTATLEPLTVTPTTEEQTFTPESPCIGFSSVVVEAVEDTGGGDSGETVTYPSAEDATFGTTTSGAELYTGKYFYGTLSFAVNLPEPPDSTYLRAALVYYVSGDTKALRYMLSTGRMSYDNSPPVSTWSSGTLTFTPTGAKHKIYLYDFDSETWSLEKEGDGKTSVAGTPRWTNYGIRYYRETSSVVIYLEPSDPVPETVDSAEIEYIETAETYAISGATLNALGAVTQQITGIAATTPSAMVSALQMYAGTH